MIAIAQFIAISCYLAAAALAAVPFARPVRASVRGVMSVLGFGVLAHLSALVAFARQAGAVSLSGLGPSLSFAGLVLAITLLLVEFLARDASLTLLVAPLAAIPTVCANIIGLTPGRSADSATRSRNIGTGSRDFRPFQSSPKCGPAPRRFASGKWLTRFGVCSTLPPRSAPQSTNFLNPS